MADQPVAKFTPLVTGETTATSPNVESILGQMRDGRYRIADYQRDSSQWDADKKSLFIESLVNNLTVPPLIVCPVDGQEGEVREVVDGQQRLTTIRAFLQDEFPLSKETDVDYEDNVGPLIQGKKFSELPEKIRKQITGYTLNIIVLPRGLSTDLRRKIFRRINEAGIPLSAHDLRLSDFSESKAVSFIRIAGIFDKEREGAKRMLESSKLKFNIDYPWKNNKPWDAWWEDSVQSAGQAASQMFLYYLIARNLNGMETLLNSGKTITQLGMKYDGTITWVLDVYCAQLKHQESSGSAQILADFQQLTKWFEDFELWFNKIKAEQIPKIKVNSSTKIAFFIAAAAETWKDPAKVTFAQWEMIRVFATEGPANIKEKIGVNYPIPKGKWPGQKSQIIATFEICQKIQKSQ